MQSSFLILSFNISSRMNMAINVHKAATYILIKLIIIDILHQQKGNTINS